MDNAFPGYSAAQALRSGGVPPVRGALIAARQRTLAQADAYAHALDAQGMRVAYDATLNPPLWEMGHIGWFQEWWIGRNPQREAGVSCDPDAVREPPVLPHADSFYDSGRIAHARRWEFALQADATRAYLRETLERTLRLLDGLPANASDGQLYFFRLAALHEEMHAEAGAYMARTLGISLPGAGPAARQVASCEAIQVPAQVFRLGYDGPGFAFDNELGPHDVALTAFEIDALPVSCARFKAFIDAGGYEDPRWWSGEGWQWRLQARNGPPAMQDLDGPALHLSAHEAQAWCQWAGRRLPTEAQWECAAMTAAGFDWGGAWEWTSTIFMPYEGFTPHPYRDYSAPWFGSRRVLRGACPATSPALAHPRYRNFFEPGRHDIFSGFRSCAAP